MITNGEISILKMISQKSLVKKSELVKVIGELNPSCEKILEMLKQMGYIEIVSPLGEASLVVTQKGMKLVSDSES